MFEIYTFEILIFRCFLSFIYALAAKYRTIIRKTSKYKPFEKTI